MIDLPAMSNVLNSEQTVLLSSVISALGQEDFCDRLMAFLHCCVEFDGAVILAYPEDALQVLKDELHNSDRAGFDGPYRNGMYLLSPLYTESRTGMRGCFHISDIAPEGFIESEFYEIYYSKNDTIDQMAFLLETDSGTPIAISIERTSSLKRFSKKERLALKQIEHLIDALVKKNNWPQETGLSCSTAHDMHTHLQQVLNLFGSSVLTPRERDVVRLILRGYPSKSVARELNISIQTEQVHRKNIYQKLNISSHSELFALFFDAITLPPDPDNDPLLALRAQQPVSLIRITH